MNVEIIGTTEIEPGKEPDDAWGRARALHNPDGFDELVVCAGAPICNLQGKAAIEAQCAGCTLCTHIVMPPDGSETEYKIKASNHA